MADNKLSLFIKEKYDATAKTYSQTDINKASGGTPESFFKSPTYRMVMNMVGKAIKRFENGQNKDYYKHVYITQGDYTKRKGYEGSIYVSMKEQAKFVQEYVSENSFAKYTILGVHSDIWDILNSEKWKIAFKKSFQLDTADSSIIDCFRLIYVSLVLAFEMISMKIVDFKYYIYSGMSGEDAINKIQNDNKNMVKNLVSPVIDIIALCNAVKVPLVTLETLHKDEVNGLKSTEAYDPTKSEEGVFESTGKFIIDQFKTHVVPKVGSVLKFAFKDHKWVGIVSVAILALILAFHASRTIIYYIGIHKINIEKQLEIQCELIENNINELKEKCDRASGEEKARYQKIIDRQLEYKQKYDMKLGKMVESDGLQASIALADTMDTDLDSSVNEAEASSPSYFALEI